MSHFHKLFPEVTESNQTGKLSKDAFALWEDSKNNINIELDTGNDGLAARLIGTQS